MRRVGRDGIVSEPKEVDDVTGDDRSRLAGGELQLRTILKLTVADVVSACGVYAALAKQQSDVRRLVLIEVDLHRAKRKSPGYCFSTASAVSAAFASIWA